jgi:acetate---CoA ligase (ADP-forming)
MMERSMTQPALDLVPLLDPSGIAVVGPSPDPSTMGGQALWALSHFGYKGSVSAVHPTLWEIGGVRCYPTVAEVPQPCDVALIASEPGFVAEAVEQCGTAGIRFAVILSPGFAESGEAGRDLQQRILTAASTHGVRILGPNCQGFLNARKRVYAGFSGIFRNPNLRPGPAAMVMQSGFGFALAGAAEYAGVGFNYMVSTGNEADIDAMDLIEYLLEKDDIEIICAYLQGVADGERLRAVGARALQLAKPILVWKVGKSASGMSAAASHTGRLTGRYDLYRVAFREGGFIEIGDLQEIIDVAGAFSMKRFPRGQSVGVVTVTGGAGVEIADRCEERGLEIPHLSDVTVDRLRQLAPGRLHHPANPLDVGSTSVREPGLYRSALDAVLSDPSVHQVIACNGGIQGEAATHAALELVAAAEASSKPLLVCWTTPPGTVDDALRLLEEHRIPCYTTPARVVTAASALAVFAQKLTYRPAYRTAARSVDRTDLRLHRDDQTLCTHRSLEVLAAYGIPVTRSVLLSEDQIATLRAPPLPFPLALKLDSPDVLHKTDSGLVRIGIRTLEELQRAGREVFDRADHMEGARIHGVLAQEMVEGIEVIVGTIWDSTFGPAVLLGMGGIFADVLRDVTHRFAPFEPECGKEMMSDLRASSIFQGVRGQPPADVDALAETLSNASWLAADQAEQIAEIDVNPLFVKPAGHGVAAADASVILRAMKAP